MNLFFRFKFNKSSTKRIKNYCTEKEFDSELEYHGKNKKLRILLIRHGESFANVDKSIMKKKADHSIPLTPNGFEQSKIVGEKIKNYFKDLEDRKIEKKRHIRIWHSPMLRAKQTAETIKEVASEYITDSREHIMLSEQQFGLFEALTIEEIKDEFPKEYAHFIKCIESNGRFYARMPLGESRFDVAQRIALGFGTFHRDARSHNIQDLIIVSHGVTLRAFRMMWLHKSVQWFEEEKNPDPCSISLIEHNKDKGLLFEGFKQQSRVSPLITTLYKNKNDLN